MAAAALATPPYGGIGRIQRKAERVAANNRSDQPFGKALQPFLLAREEFLTQTGNVNYRLVAEALENVHYETLRKAVAGERLPNLRLIEQVAELVGVEPDFFAEYQLALARRDFDIHEVGWETAMRNLQAWSAKQRKR